MFDFGISHNYLPTFKTTATFLQQTWHLSPKNIELHVYFFFQSQRHTGFESPENNGKVNWKSMAELFYTLRESWRLQCKFTWKQEINCKKKILLQCKQRRNTRLCKRANKTKSYIQQTQFSYMSPYQTRKKKRVTLKKSILCRFFTLTQPEALLFLIILHKRWLKSPF